MNIFKLLITGVMVISTSANSQEAKAHLRDFTPKYQIDTFQIEGDIKLLKRRVIESQKAEGIKSAYWDDASHILTVQYNSRLRNLPLIKSFFLYNKPLIIKEYRQKQNTTPAFGCCINNYYSINQKNKK